METKEAEQVVANTISQSEKLEARRVRMEKIRLLLAVSGFGILYLTFAGLSCVLKSNDEQKSALFIARHPDTWYENPVIFYIWVGVFITGCVTVAFLILWRTQQLPPPGIRIGRHRVKGFLTILMDILVVVMLHTYVANIANHMEQ